MLARNSLVSSKLQETAWVLVAIGLAVVSAVDYPWAFYPSLYFFIYLTYFLHSEYKKKAALREKTK